MNNRIGLIILAIVAVGLAVGLFVIQKKAHEEKERDTDTIVMLSNKWVAVSGDLDEQRQVNVMLTNDLSARATQLVDMTNKLTDTTTALTKSEDSLKTATDDLAKRDARIFQLEGQNQELDKRAQDLSNTITNLSNQIAETQRKLNSSEGDKAFLEKELNRLMGEKAEMERRFNDLDTMRAQVRKLKEELYTARRLDWMRRGIMGDQKAAELMTSGSPDRGTKAAPRYDLNVEVGSDGSIHVTPNTNAPAAATP